MRHQRQAGRLFVYWALFAFFAIGVLFRPITQDVRPAGSPMLLAGALAIAVLIGLRYEVGADWTSYRFMFSYAGYEDLFDLMSLGDPAYHFVNWAANRVGAELWLVNSVCGAIFSWGLYRFARAQPDPWLAFVLAVPYLVIVVAMGYTRQAVALGILLAGLASLKRDASVLRFAAYVAVAALFHKSAVIALPLVIFAGERNRLLNVVAGVALTILFYDIFLAESVQTYVKNYLEQEYNSQGAAIRVAMNLLPATLMLLIPKRFGFSPSEERVWCAFSLAAFGLLIMLLISPSSTAVDRVALYIMPLQLAVLSRAYLLFGWQKGGKLALVSYAFAIQFTWLNFAAHAQYWIPYRFYPIAA